MLNDFQPIVIDTPKEFPYIEIYFIHDLHKGNHLFDQKKWDGLKREIMAEPYRYAVHIGDALENATPNSKSDMFYQTIPPHEQKEWYTEQLIDMGEKTLLVVDGNHEKNRTTKVCGMFPLYDACLAAGIKDRYRPHFAMLDIGAGRRRDTGADKQVRYFGYCVHKAKSQTNFSSADTIDGIDFFAYGHDHNPKDIPRAKLVYDSKNKKLTEKSIEVINSGSFLTYGGYAADSAYRPASSKMYKLILDGTRKNIKSLGFYV